MNNGMKRGLALLSGLAISVSAHNAAAQQEVYLEEIITTAQKREQSQQEVPVAVSTFTGAMLQDAGIQDIHDLAAITPTLRSNQSQNSTTASFGIRGVGTSSQNFGLESSVGIYIDGVYRSRQSSIINDLADIEAVEVLRGPQGTLFGKNTPSGALVIRTVKPDNDLNAFFEVTAGEYGLVNVKAATNIPIKEDVASARATIFTGKRDGVVSAVDRTGAMDTDAINNRDRFGGRFQLYLTPNDRFDARFILDYAEIDEICCAALTRGNNFMGASGAGSDAFLAFGLGVPVIAAEAFDDYVMALNEYPRSTNEDAGISAELNYDFENATLTSISAFRQFDSTDLIDADFSAADLLFDENLGDQRSFSQELRLTGEFGEANNYVAGVYYFTQELNNVSTLTLGENTAAFFSLDPTLSAVTGAVNALAPLSAFGLPYQTAANAFPDGYSAIDDMRQEHESFAVFAQADFALSETLTLTAGLRYTDETKDLAYDFLNSPALGPPLDLAAITSVLTGIGIWQVDPALPGALDPTNPANVPTVLGALGPTYSPGWGMYTLDAIAPQAGGTARLKDDRVTGTAKLSWFATDDTMFYVSYGTGYKSGGTNTDRINPQLPQTFGPETSEAIEIGMKADFPSQNVRLNVALHSTEVKDLQTNAFSGTGFNLQNAGLADTYGGEVEMLWLPGENTDVQLSYAYNIADLKDFKFGTCWVATPFLTGVDDPGRADPNDAFCDRSGGRVASNPEHNLFLGVKQAFRVGDSTEAYIRGEYTYISDTMTDGNNEPLKLRPSFDRFNLRVGLIFEEWDAELAIWGKNLTDERYYETVFDVPVQDGKLNAYPHDPRSWGATFRKNFN